MVEGCQQNLSEDHPGAGRLNLIRAARQYALIEMSDRGNPIIWVVTR